MIDSFLLRCSVDQSSGSYDSLRHDELLQGKFDRNATGFTTGSILLVGSRCYVRTDD
jgi:hypothetical protein